MSSIALTARLLITYRPSLSGAPSLGAKLSSVRPVGLTADRTGGLQWATINVPRIE